MPLLAANTLENHRHITETTHTAKSPSLCTLTSLRIEVCLGTLRLKEISWSISASFIESALKMINPHRSGWQENLNVFIIIKSHNQQMKAQQENSDEAKKRMPDKKMDWLKLDRSNVRRWRYWFFLCSCSLKFSKPLWPNGELVVAIIV